MMDISGKFEKCPLLNLPDIEKIEIKSIGWQYGADHLAAAYCGLKNTPGMVRGMWQHGWVASYRIPVFPQAIFGANVSPDVHAWVSRKNEKECLQSAGFKNVEAIGLPVVYLPSRKITRRPGSLLVMPIHTLHYTTASFNFDAFAEAIAAIRHNFTEVVVCIHPSCLKHGYWVDAFRSRGFDIITGANYNDRNSLERVRYLLSTFEYMVTNSYGSQLAYAAYFGAKPSIYGPYATFREEDFKNDPFYRRNPGLLSITLEAISEQMVRRNLPWLFCNPQEAVANVEWGRFEVGAANKVSPRKLKSLFGWTLADRASQFIKLKTPDRLKKWARRLTNRACREEWKETRRLKKMPSGHPTSTNLLGRPFELLDSARFIKAKETIFDRQTYRFFTNEDKPRILDCGAGVGLTILYFKKLYPRSEVIAFEPNPRVYEMLKRNCDSWKVEDVRLIQKAVWNRETTVFFPTEEGASGRIAEKVMDENIPKVETCRLRDYMSERVDLLRLDIEGEEIEVLLDCADLLGNVKNMILDYHSLYKRPQRLDVLMTVLTTAGFRMHFVTASQTWSPLVQQTIIAGMDCQLTILAFRE